MGYILNRFDFSSKNNNKFLININLKLKYSEIFMNVYFTNQT